MTSEVSASESAPVRRDQPYEGLFWEERGGRQRVEMHQSHLLVFIIIILVAGSHQKPPQRNRSIIPEHPVGHGGDIPQCQGSC